MKNTEFTSQSDDLKRSKMARVLMQKAWLSPEIAIQAAQELDLSKQYSFVEVPTHEEFIAQIKEKEIIISQSEKWVEKVIRTSAIILDDENGSLAAITEQSVGSLDLNKAEFKYLLVYCKGTYTPPLSQNKVSTVNILSVIQTIQERINALYLLQDTEQNERQREINQAIIRELKQLKQQIKNLSVTNP